MESVEFIPHGVCARKITFDVEGTTVHNIKFDGGCNGNLRAVGKLCEGMEAEKLVQILEGNLCGAKGTSCADQLAKGVKKAVLEK